MNRVQASENHQHFIPASIVSTILADAHLSVVSRAYDYMEGVNVSRAHQQYVQHALHERLGLGSLLGEENLLAAYQALAREHGMSSEQTISRYLHDVKELNRATDEALDELRYGQLHLPVTISAHASHDSLRA